MDSLRGFGELALGSRLKRLSEHIMKETQKVYNHFNIDFDPYLFPIINIIDFNKGITNAEIKSKLNLSQPAITQAINKLKTKGLVIISTNKIDKRKKGVVLSKKGTQLIKQMKPLWETIDELIKNYTQRTSNSLIEHINMLEDKLFNKSFSNIVIEKSQMKINNPIKIIDFDDKYSKDFYELNIEWLKSYFYVEPYDEEVLSKPSKYIIKPGGHIFFAKKENIILGTVALMPTKNHGVFELTKMAVSPIHRGYKIGQKLMQKCIDFAKSKRYKSLILYSNTKLENAIYIYKKYGFTEIPVESNSPYVRSDIKMEVVFN